ncbi:MAG TPA: protein-glutamine glutaminase family protein [Thermoanaerobaculia bacterium]|nr:protein-glutamine glutaminase family protein [Thermoanaerobaculia bacterium]
MVNVEFVHSGAQIPDPDGEGFFDRSARQGFRRQMESLARQRNSLLFVAKEEESLVAVGLAKVRQVLAVEDGQVRISESHARHRRSPDVPLTVGRWYKLAIDPGTNVILGAEEEPQAPPALPPTERFPVDLDQLPSVTASEAAAFFSRLRRQPHIPFQYPLNGCWARAHEMCRLIERHFDGDPQQDVVAKIWNQGQLIVPTDNSPDCRVEWSYHVAPVVRVGEELLVLDPALFERPVSVESWRQRQSDLSNPPVFTTRRAYDLVEGESFVAEGPGATQELLQLLWVDLIAQVYQNGPLPYQCGG